MTSLSDITIQTEYTSGSDEPGMLDAVLQELVRLLDIYLAHGESGAIDIRSLPLSPGDYTRLQQRLGKGEISIHARLSGDSDIYETDYAGIWWICHRNMDNRVIAEYIEVAAVPAIVCAHKADIEQARKRLTES